MVSERVVRLHQAVGASLSQCVVLVPAMDAERSIAAAVRHFVLRLLRQNDGGAPRPSRDEEAILPSPSAAHDALGQLRNVVIVVGGLYPRGSGIACTRRPASLLHCRHSPQLAGRMVLAVQRLSADAPHADPWRHPMSSWGRLPDQQLSGCFGAVSRQLTAAWQAWCDAVRTRRVQGRPPEVGVILDTSARRLPRECLSTDQGVETPSSRIGARSLAVVSRRLGSAPSHKWASLVSGRDADRSGRPGVTPHRPSPSSSAPEVALKCCVRSGGLCSGRAGRSSRTRRARSPERRSLPEMGLWGWKRRIWGSIWVGGALDRVGTISGL